MAAHFDYIVVGGGSSGCVLANRLTARSNVSVLLLEAGPDTPPGLEPRDILDVYPTSYYNDSYLWPGLKAHWRSKETSSGTGFPQGRIMGGGSSVMGMIALRGTPDDYREWEEAGAAGWGWDSVLPYFRRLETDLDFTGALHGSEGPVPLRRVPSDVWPPLTNAFAEYAASQGMPFVPDMNADFQDGFGPVPMSSWPDKRGSASICYLTDDVRRRPNLTVMSGCTVTDLVFEGRRVTGVAASAGAETHRFTARETVLSMGAVHSPALLLRSGIGEAEAIRDLGIEPMLDLPGVGMNLQNHAILFVGLHLRKEARQPDSLRTHPTVALRYSSGLPGAQPSDMYLNIQSKTSWNAMGRHVANIAPVLLKPSARGRIALTSSERGVAPLIEFNFAGNPLDRDRLVAGFRRAVQAAAFPQVAKLAPTNFPVRFSDRLRTLNRLSTANAVKSAMIARMLDLVPQLSKPVFGTLADRRVDLLELIRDESQLAEYVERNVAGMFHAVGTCRMGDDDDPMAVVDPSGRVRGVAGLRVVDASIMPTIPRGNTNISTIMVAEKISAEMTAAPETRLQDPG